MKYNILKKILVAFRFSRVSHVIQCIFSATLSELVSLFQIYIIGVISSINSPIRIVAIGEQKYPQTLK